jgi:D-galactarolactone cycloisomerase
MKITELEGIKLRCPCSTISDALGSSTARQAFLIKITTDSGIWGIGEAFTYGAPLGSLQEILDQQIAPVLIGQNPEFIEKLWQTMYWRTIANGRRGLTMAVISGVDIALWDLLGKSCGLPVCKLLGQYRGQIPAYASGGFYAPGKGLEELGNEIEGYLKKGYRDVKIKAGRTLDRPDAPLQYMGYQKESVTLDEDWERIRLVKKLIGKGRLIVDVNASWNTRKGVQNARKLLDLGVEVIEEPLPFEDTEGYRAISAAAPELLIAGCETQQGLKNFKNMITEGHIDIVQPDVGWAGGISEVRKIGTFALAHGKNISLHCFGSAVLFAASLQVAASMANTTAMESEENPNPLKTEITTVPFETDPKMDFTVPEAPGLGIEIDWDRAGQFLV